MNETNIQGTVARITFRNEENGYTVAKIKCHNFNNKEIAVVGNFPSIDVGEIGDFYGEWIDDPQYGRQFKATRLDFIAPTTVSGIERLLSKGKFKGIGAKYAKLIVEHFGKNTIDIIENKPESLLEVRGIGKKKAEDIARAWTRKKSLKDINLYLAEKNIPLRYAEKIFSRYKGNAITVLRKNPYQLTYDIRGIGFRTADKIALSIGVNHNSMERVKAALNYLLELSADEGNIYLPEADLVEKGTEYLELEAETIKNGVESLASDNKIILEDGNVFLRFLYSTEYKIVKRLFEIKNYRRNDDNVQGIDAEVKEEERESGVTYTDKQKQAITEALTNKVVLITGGPGTGKTTLIKTLLKLFLKRNYKVRLASPTGRAAKRMEETCHYPAQTIHRMLDFNPQSGTFKRNMNAFLDADAVIIDELSMIDSPLMAALVSGLDNSARLVLVGDADQLPSVGPGNVLKELITSGALPVIRLDVIFRQEQTSDIVAAAHNINNRIVPEIDNAKNKNLFFIYEKDSSKIPAIIADLIKRRLPEKYNYSPMKDVQVLTPMYKADTGAKNLNVVLQKALNPSGKSIQRGERIFVEGDKVMQVRNNYNKEVYNGDIGFVSAIHDADKIVDISFDNNTIPYSYEELIELVHAYAITVHKSQGSEYKAVIMPLTTQHYIMLQKNLLYTAVTRAKELIIIIGTTKALNIAVRNDKTANRFSNLSERMRKPDSLEKQLNLIESSPDSGYDWY